MGNNPLEVNVKNANPGNTSNNVSRTPKYPVNSANATEIPAEPRMIRKSTTFDME